MGVLGGCTYIYNNREDREDREDRENRDDRTMISSPHQPYQAKRPYRPYKTSLTLSSEAILSSEAPPFILLKSQKELFSLLFEAFELFCLFGPCPPQSAHNFSLEVLRLSNYRSAAPTTVAIFDLKSRGKRLSVRCTRLVSMMITRSFSGSMTIDVPVAPV